MIAGAAVHYEEQVLLSELKSPRRGDNVCVLQIELDADSDASDFDWSDHQLAVI